MDDAEQVDAYHAAGETTLDLIYCLATELVHMGLSRVGTSLLDLGCGSANWVSRLAGVIKPCRIHAMDASVEMIRLAKSNPRIGGVNSEIFIEVHDITRLEHIPDRSFGLTTCSLTAHHLESVSPTVVTLLREMDRVTDTNGMVFMLDLARLTSWNLTKSYVNVFSSGQSSRHNEDFLNSMLAAFTPEELAMAIPPDTDGCRWLHFTAPLLPTIQVVMRIPRSQVPTIRPVWDKSPTSIVSDREWRWLRGQFRKRCLQAWEARRL